MGLMVANSAAFSSCVRRISSFVFTSLSVLAIRFGCGLSFRFFCAESPTLLLISITAFCAFIFFFIVCFVVKSRADSVFLLSASFSVAPIFYIP
jgi:hypothetical protein